MLNEGFDIALRVRTHPTGEDGLVMRSFGEVRELLVASPQYLDRLGRPREPDELAELDTLAFDTEADRQIWELGGPDSQVMRIEIAPRLCSHDFVVLQAAALAGLGIIKLPENVGRQARGAQLSCSRPSGPE